MLRSACTILTRPARISSPERAPVRQVGDHNNALVRPVNDGGRVKGTTALRALSLTRNIVWTVPANIIYLGCQWLIVAVLAKSGSTELVGQYAIASAIAVPIALLADFRLRVLFVTEANGKYRLDHILGLRFILAGLSIIAMLVTCNVADYRGSTRLVILLVGVVQIIDSVSDTFYAKFQRDEHVYRIAISQIIRGVLSVSFFTTVMYLTQNLGMGIVALLFGRLAVLLLYDARDHGSDERLRHPLPLTLRPAWDGRRQLDMLWRALPLAVTYVLVLVNGYAPRYALESFATRADLGIYAAIGFVPSAYFVLTSAVGLVIFPRLAKLYSGGDLKGFLRLLLRVALIYGALGLGGLGLSVVAGPKMLTIVYRPEYGRYAFLLRYLMLVALLQNLTTAMQAGLTAASRFHEQLLLLTCVTASSFAACVILVPRMGLTGAAVATLMSNSVQLVGSTWFVFRAMRMRANEVTEFAVP